MNMGVHHTYHLDLCADDEDPSQLIIRPGWDAPHIRCFPRTFCAWPCLLRQVGTVLGSPYDYVVVRLAYANPGSRHTNRTPPLGDLPPPATPLPLVGHLLSLIPLFPSLLTSPPLPRKSPPPWEAAKPRAPTGGHTAARRRPPSRPHLRLPPLPSGIGHLDDLPRLLPASLAGRRARRAP